MNETDTKPIDLQQVASEIVAKSPGRRKRELRGNTEEMIAMRLENKSYSEIAKTQGLHVTSVYQRLSPYFKQIEQFQVNKTREADLYRFKAFEALSYITQKKLDKASAYQLALIAGAMHDHALKTEGKFDSTIDIKVINMDLAKLKEEKEGLYARLNELAQENVDNALSNKDIAPPGGEKGAALD